MAAVDCHGISDARVVYRYRHGPRFRHFEEDQLLADTKSTGSRLSNPRPERSLGLFSASCLVVASMVGTGVFTTSGFALGALGEPAFVLLAWLVGGLIALCGAISYGALARRMPESGGEYYFLSRTIHPLAGFLAGWISLLAGFTAPIAVAALALQEYLSPLIALDVRKEWIGTTAILLVGCLHAFRMARGTWLQNAAVLLKLFAMVALIVWGCISLSGREAAVEVREAVEFSLGAFSVQLVWISFSYAGWNAAVYVAGEVRDPERSLHRSLILGTSIVTLIYLALNAVLVYSDDVGNLAGRADIAAAAALSLGGEAMRLAVCGVVSLALLTSISAMVMAGPRVYARMAGDGFFPRAWIPDGGPPTFAIAFQVAASVLVVWLGELEQVLGYVGWTLSISSAATVVALFILRRREGPVSVPVFGYPWVPGFFVLATIGASVFMAVQRGSEAGFGAITVLAGIPLYFVLKKSV